MWAKVVIGCAIISFAILFIAIFVPMDGFYSANVNELGIGLGLICAFFIGIAAVDLAIFSAYWALSKARSEEYRPPELSVAPDAIVAMLYVFYLSLSFFEQPAKSFISHLRLWEQDFASVVNFSIFCAIFICLKLFLSNP